jgi:hypothetical protein
LVIYSILKIQIFSIFDYCESLETNLHWLQYSSYLLIHVETDFYQKENSKIEVGLAINISFFTLTSMNINEVTFPWQQFPHFFYVSDTLSTSGGGRNVDDQNVDRPKISERQNGLFSWSEHRNQNVENVFWVDQNSDDQNVENSIKNQKLDFPLRMRDSYKRFVKTWIRFANSKDSYRGFVS